MRRGLAVLAFSLAAGLATAVSAAPAMWKATDADSTIWLFGSIHILQEGIDWRTPAFDEALDAADYVYYELLLNAEAYSEIPALMLRDGFTPEGEYISDYLTEEQYQRLQRMAVSFGLSPHYLDPQRPWMAMMTLSGLAFGSDLTTTGGVEIVLQGEIDDARERGFETASEQMGFFTGLSDEAQVTMLMEMVDAWAEGDETNVGSMLGGLTETMFDTWESGDVDGLEKLIESSPSLSGGELEETILDRRNENWVNTIEELMQGSDDIMVVVGAAHLVGDHGVPALLEQRGIKVERVQ